jgi:AmiR/NasT family two-component response regulator
MSGTSSRHEHLELINQAQAIVCAQAGATLPEALALLEKTATAADETLEVVAELVATGEIRFDTG